MSLLAATIRLAFDSNGCTSVDGDGVRYRLRVNNVSSAARASYWDPATGGNGHWYAVIESDQILHWDHALQEAELLGDHLATLTSPEENQFILPFVPSVVTNPGPGYWIGGRDFGSGWEWITVNHSYASGVVDRQLYSAAVERCRTYLFCECDELLLVGTDFIDWQNSVGYVVEWSNTDCNNNGAIDSCDIADGTSQDVNQDGIPDECVPIDCNQNGVDDQVDIDSGASPDCDLNGVPDECELEGSDCDSDDLLDICEEDCNEDSIPDDCQDLADCNVDGTPDVCESFTDCDANGVPDECDPDFDGDGIPDACDADIDGDGVPNECDVDFAVEQPYPNAVYWDPEDGGNGHWYLFISEEWSWVDANNFAESAGGHLAATTESTFEDDLLHHSFQMKAALSLSIDWWIS